MTGAGRVVTARIDETLQVINAVHLFGFGQLCRAVEKLQAFALRAEQGFQHELAAAPSFPLKDGSGRFGALADPSGRRRQPDPVQQEAGHGLVHRVFDGPGVVIDGNAELTQAVEKPQPQRNLLHGTRIDEPHKHTVGKGVLEAR